MAKVKQEPKVVHGTCVVERSLSRPPSDVFQALSQPEKVRQWMGPSGDSELVDFRCDFREGGSQVLQYQMGPDSPLPGVTIRNEACFQQIVQDERIVVSSTMKRDRQTFSASLLTFELLPTSAGTDLIITHQGAFFEGADGPEMRKQGWNFLADRIATVLATETATARRG